MMRIDILTVLPEMIEGMVNCSIVKRAQDKGLAEIHLHNLRDYTTNKWRRVDDYPFGGEAGMVMQIEPIDRAISALKSERDYDEVIYTSPDGETFNQPMANSMSMLNNLIILCGHYKGIDYRIREHLITKENIEQEFLSVIREYERVIYKVCYLYTTPNATLSDLYQEVVLNIWKAFPKFRRECKISTWIYRIALNTCISFIRKEKNIPEIVTLTQEADRSEEDDETQAMLRQLYRMINRLGQLEKSIILLYLEEKSYEEIAEITGLTITNVATKLNRIKDKLKKMNKEE